MALTKKDLQQIQDLLTTQFSAQDARCSVAFAQQRQELNNSLVQQSQDIKRDVRDETDARFVASETKMEKLLRHELQAVIDILLTSVPERFEKLEHDMVRVKTHIGLA